MSKLLQYNLLESNDLNGLIFLLKMAIDRTISYVTLI